MTQTDAGRPAGWFERSKQAWIKRHGPVTVIEPVRVGVAIDGVMAPTDWKTPPWHVRNGWERQLVLDAEGLAELAHRARSDAWEVYAITARPTGPGSTTQQQTRRWLERHDAGELSVVVDRGRRREIVRALDLDWLVDDTLANCCTAQLETAATGIWITQNPERHERIEAEASGCVIAASLEEAVAVIDG